MKYWVQSLIQTYIAMSLVFMLALVPNSGDTALAIVTSLAWPLDLLSYLRDTLIK